MNYNDFFNICRSRRSVRNFIKKDINNEDIKKIIQAGIQAPSPTNSQGWKFRIINRSNEIKNFTDIIEEKIKKLTDNLSDGVLKQNFKEYSKNFIFFNNSGAVILLYSKKPKNFLKEIFPSKISYIKGYGNYLSLGMVMQNMMLAAHTLGISTCPLTGPLIAEKEINSLYKPPSKHEFCAIISLGYTNLNPASPGRKDLNKFII